MEKKIPGLPGAADISYICFFLQRMGLSLQEHILKSREAVAANRAKGNRHAELLSRLYSDPFRFLDEILQNTEDAYARKFANGGRGTLQFRYTDTCLDIIHDGIDFDEEDLKAITTFAGTTKTRADGINQIGKFGIGFRSVYALTDHPEIHSGPWHFRIDDFEVLEETERIPVPADFGTLIRLPYRSSDLRSISKWVREALESLDAYSILFLKHVDTIEVYFRDKLHRTLSAEQVALSDSLTRKMIHDRSRSQRSTRHLIIHDAEGNQSDHCAIAFRMDTKEDGSDKIVREELPWLFVYFPTRQESHLGFLLHARFTTTPTREAVPFDQEKTPENIKLLGKAASLLVQSLVSLRNLGFIDASFFEVLPLAERTANPVDVVYEAFRKEVIRALQQKKIVPDHSGHFAVSREMIFTHEPLIAELIDPDSLGRFYQRSYWLHPDFRALPSLVRVLIRDCSVKEADAAGIAFRISVEPDFLGQQSVKWHKLFYTFLSVHPELWDGLHKNEHYSLRYKPLIRLKSGENVPAYGPDEKAWVFLPSGKYTKPHDIHPVLLKDETCFNFFQMLGITVRPEKESLQTQLDWTCEKNAGEVAVGIDLQMISEQPIDFIDHNGIALFPGIHPLGNLLNFSDPFMEMMQWSVQCAQVLLMKKFPGAFCQPTTPDSAQITLQYKGNERTVYVACRSSMQHRFQMPAMDWADMGNDRRVQSLLLLISEAGTGVASALMLENPGGQIKKGRFISDPIGFNLLDL